VNTSTLAVSATDHKKKVGVFGGAFDPPHLAHRALAAVALEQLKLDVLHVLPTGQAWHKTRPLTPAHHRIAMAEFNFSGLDHMLIDQREILRPGPSYTLDTLRELQAEMPEADLFLVMGKDQADVLPTWKDWELILDLAMICVADRDGLTGQQTQFIPPPAMAHRFERLNMPLMDISATGIRARVATDLDARGITPLVCEPVARYIEAHHLYAQYATRT
jgi:nicotinate-nucleotide adenylyltransferase